ncbi:lytic transglycosylase domain-containing protein [Denitromonas sp.]|uniref:lytic transglycosylase domain-containing protein n=1 Tax=Denitromonas sp. TaxID=2734609 RepID=UPI002AFEF475|nr:lytic transglycosylase domain-containing protein [Denitromonas sp.]
MFEFALLAQECAPQVHVTTLAAIVRQESAGNPFAIGINGGARLPRQPQTKAEAVATAEWLQANGYNFDAGVGQINVRNLGWLGMSVEDLFDPCINLKGAATVLSDCYRRAVPKYGEGQPALHAALSCYNTGDFSKGFANGYVMKVAANAALPIPALAPISQTPGEPVKLRSSARPISVNEYSKADERDRKQPGNEDDAGIGDAFSRAAGDAFNTSTAREGARMAPRQN